MTLLKEYATALLHKNPIGSRDIESMNHDLGDNFLPVEIVAGLRKKTETLPHNVIPFPKGHGE